MNESQYNALIEQTFETLELILDEIDDDLDYETVGGVLTLEFVNGSSLVFSRQPPTRQLWLAARSGGFHFAWDEGAQDWRNTRDKTLFRPFVVKVMREQGGVEFNWGEECD